MNEQSVKDCVGKRILTRNNGNLEEYFVIEASPSGTHVKLGKQLCEVTAPWCASKDVDLLEILGEMPRQGRLPGLTTVTVTQP